MKKLLSFLFKAAVCIIVLYIGIFAANKALDMLNPWNGKVPLELTEYGSPHKFYYDRLSDKEKHAYNEILSHIYDMPETIRIPEINDVEFRKVFSALLYDNPDLFFIGRKCSLASNFFVTECSLEYTMTPEEYAESKAELDRKCDEILFSLSDPADEWQTELEIHDFIIKNCEYKLVEDEFIYSSSYGAIINGEAACEGYSKAAKMLFDLAGLESAVIVGESDGGDGAGPHMWNVVSVDGEYYHLDCTWDDAGREDGERLSDYSYFNLSDEMIKKTHSDFSYEFNCDSTEANYHVKTGGYFTSYGKGDEKRVADLANKEMAGSRTAVRLRFSNSSEYENAVYELVDKERICYVMQRAAEESDIEKYKLSCTKNPDQYVLTFIIEG